MKAWIVIMVSLAACSPTQCRVTEIRVEDHPTLPKPAAAVKVKCDGREIVDIEARGVQK